MVSHPTITSRLEPLNRGRDALPRVQADQQVGPTGVRESPHVQRWARIGTMNCRSRREEALIFFFQKV